MYQKLRNKKGCSYAKKIKIIYSKNREFDFNGDGRFSELRIKGKDKEFLKKQRRLFEKKNLIIEINNLKKEVS